MNNMVKLIRAYCKERGYKVKVRRTVNGGPDLKNSVVYEIDFEKGAVKGNTAIYLSHYMQEEEEQEYKDKIIKFVSIALDEAEGKIPEDDASFITSTWEPIKGSPLR
jgi:transposase